MDWQEQVEIEKEYVEDVEIELERLELALQTASEEIKALYEDDQNISSKDEDNPFGEPGMMLEDSEFIGRIEDEIISQKVNAEWAVKQISDEYLRTFEDQDSEFFKIKADDVKISSSKVIKLLLHVEGENALSHYKEVILVTRHLSTEQLALIQRENVMGLLSEEGSMSSHVIIMARNRQKPAVVGVENIIDVVGTGDMIILDGSTGEVILSPDEETIQIYRGRQEEGKRFREHLNTFIGQPVMTRDKVPLKILGNVGSPLDVEQVVKADGKGIGLYRTEFQYLSHGRQPSEGEQYWDYKKAVLAMHGLPVVFRTLDIGGDKVPDYLSMTHNANPALGLRAIRYSLQRVDMFKSQLRAMLRASIYGDVHILFPMISDVSEIRSAKVILEDAKKDLRQEGIPFNSNVQVGAMIEIPSAAVISDLLVKEVDFLSIGTNDLIQYTMAADRDSLQLTYLYNHFQPSIFRLLKFVMDNALKEKKKITVSGEMAGDPLVIPLLIGLGLPILSMNPSMILRAKWMLSEISYSDMQKAVEHVMTLSASDEIEAFCRSNFGRFATYA